MKAHVSAGATVSIKEEDPYSSDVGMLASDNVYEEETEETEESTETEAEDEAVPQHKKYILSA